MQTELCMFICESTSKIHLWLLLTTLHKRPFCKHCLPWIMPDRVASATFVWRHFSFSPYSEW